MGNTAYKESSAPPCQVDELVEALRQIRRHAEGYRGIHLHFSLIERNYKQPYHRRAIATAFNKLVHSKAGQLFWTRNFDVVFICKDCTNTGLDIAILAACRAVEDSPLIKEYIEAGRDDDLCDWYDLEKDMDRFLTVIEGLKEPDEQNDYSGPSLKSMVNDLKDKLSDNDNGQEQVARATTPTTPRYTPLSQQNDVAPMGPIQLDQLERNLVNMDIVRMMADQTAYVIVGNSRPQPIFVEHYISVAEIEKNLLPGYDIQTDKWLFHRLTRTFDSKLLQALPDRTLAPGQVISINLNVETVFTPIFDNFLAKIRQQNDQPLILEMRLFDVISDIEKFYAAKEKLTREGCRISLDAMDVHALAILDRELLAVDFLKIGWKADYSKLLGGPMEGKITSAISALGNMRIILCHCDTEQSLEFGKAVGIHMYQGFLIDKKFGS